MGEGRNAVFLSAKGSQVTGVEISPEAVRQAKARASRCVSGPSKPSLTIWIIKRLAALKGI